MDSGLIVKANDLVCSPGSRVRVERLNRGEFEAFEDTISCIEILATGTKWSAYYYFENHDDEAKHFEIKEVLATPRTYNPMPQPKYNIGDVIGYNHHWKKDGIEEFDRIASFSIVWDHRPDAIAGVRYLPENPSDHIYESDVTHRYIKENT